VAAVGEKSPQKKKKPSNLKEGETSRAETSERKEQRHTDRLYRTKSLKEGAM
jgi:hypothetical protein